MIRIEDFLFEENIEESLSETLIVRFPNLSFGTFDEFYAYFESQNIQLLKKTTVESQDRQTLLQRFKDFKLSSDYSLVKQYIASQRQIQSALNRGEVNTAKSLLDSISAKSVDPFFQFVVRKSLTGSDTGVLPSETLQSILNDIAKKSIVDIDTENDVIRDSTGIIQSYKNYLKNKGSLHINILDDRFLIDSFRYIVDTSFRQIPEAVDAELNILGGIGSSIPTGDIPTSSLLDELKKLILDSPNTLPALQSKVDTLQNTVQGLEELVDVKDESISDLALVIEELSTQRNSLVSQLDAKDQTIIELNSEITSTLSALGDNVKTQLENNTDAFDTLSAKLEEQAKQAKDAADKQLDAFKSSMSDIVSGIKSSNAANVPPASPGDSVDEKRRKENILQTQTLWDDIKYLSTSNVSDMDAILKKVGTSIGSSKSKFVDLSGDLKDRVSQVYNWNTLYSPQFKNYLTYSNIKDVNTSDDILNLIKRLKTTAEFEKPVRDFLYDSYSGDVFDKWRSDTNRLRGVNSGKVKEICSIIGVDYNQLHDENCSDSSETDKCYTTLPIENALRNSNFDTIITVLGLVTEFPYTNY